MTRFGGDRVHDGCNVVFEAGWHQTDGLWALTDRALREYRADRQIARGHRPWHDAKERERAGQRLTVRRSARFAHASAEHQGHDQFRAELPTCARCPCGGVNRIERSLLDEAVARAQAARVAPASPAGNYSELRMGEEGPALGERVESVQPPRAEE
jgi:hypothetical protein